MSKLSRKDFAERCGISVATLNVDVGRKKVFSGKDKKIDDQFPMNADYLEVKSKMNEVKPPTKSKKPAAKKKGAKKPAQDPKPKKGKEKKVPPKKKVIKPGEATEDEVRGKYQMELFRNDLDIRKKELEIEKLEIEVRKKKGEVIPADLVMVVMNHNFRAMTVAFHQGADNLLSTIAQQARIPVEELANFRDVLIQIVNESVKKGIKESKKGIDNVVNEYKEKRGVGESK